MQLALEESSEVTLSLKDFLAISFLSDHSAYRIMFKCKIAVKLGLHFCFTLSLDSTMCMAEDDRLNQLNRIAAD